MPRLRQVALLELRPTSIGSPAKASAAALLSAQALRVRRRIDPTSHPPRPHERGHPDVGSYNFIIPFSGMHTTIALHPETYGRLLDLKRQRRLRSMDAVVQSLLGSPVLSAQALVAPHRRRVRDLCKRRGAVRLVAFGSRVTGTARPDSDLDLAAEFQSDAGLFEVAGLAADLEDLLGVRVDLVSIGPHLGPLAKTIARDGVDALA